MGECVIQKNGGAYGSDDCTANKAQVLKGYTAITKNSNDEPAEGTIESKAAETYYAKTTDQTIAAGKYLSGAQTIKKLTQSGLSAGNILNGTTVTINNGNADVWKVTGTRVTPVRNDYAVAVKGYGVDTNVLTAESEYKMPRAGVVYYGMAMTGYGGTPRAKIELLVNNVVKNTLNLQEDSTSYSWAYSFANWQSENLAKDDTVKIRCTITSGTNVFCEIGAHYSC